MVDIHPGRFTRAVATIVALACAIPILPSDAHADPPPWAPAHGYRAKKKHPDRPDYVIYHVPYGIDRGHCDRGLISGEILGGVLGGATGGVVGSRFGKGSGKTAATIGGAIIGVMVGSAIGRSMDVVDQNCIGRVLEYAPDRQRITWSNADSGHSYAVVPTNTYERAGRYCREYQTTATISGRRQNVYGTACRQPDGAWQIVQ